MQALVSIFSWSFLATAKASWMLASMNSSEDPLKYLGIWENYVQCIQTNMSHKDQATVNYNIILKHEINFSIAHCIDIKIH